MAETVLRIPLTRVDPDLALVRRMAEGDTAALGELYARHAGGLLAYLGGRLGDRRLAEELLQDVMLAAWKAAPGFRGESMVRTWLLTIAHHRAVTARRRSRVLERLASSGADRPGSSEPEPDAELADLIAALGRLPRDQRAALELVFAHGLTMSEAAQVLGVAPGTVKSRVHRAKRLLRAMLGSGEPKHD